MAEEIKYNEDLRTGTDKLNASIRNANKAKDDSKEALIKAIESMNLSERTQKELTEAILAGDSSPLGGQLSVGADGKVYDGPQERLVAENRKVTEQLESKAYQSDLLVERERINNIIAHAGDTDGNAELLDIRVSYDGTIYESAGEAVRAIGAFLIEEGQLWEVEG